MATNVIVSTLLALSCVQLASAGATVKTSKAGDGSTFAVAGKQVKLHYVGTLVKGGKEFDSSREAGEPIEYVVGRQEVIPCWEEAMPKLSLGETATITCTSDVGYGKEGAPAQGIPANADLNFEVEILAVTDEPEEKDEPKDDEEAMANMMAGGGGDPEGMFPKLDADGDGEITEEDCDNAEFKAAVKRKNMPASEIFKQMDKDQNGKSDINEFFEWVWKQTSHNMGNDDFVRSDKNKDGIIDKEEYPESAHGYQFIGQAGHQAAQTKGTKPDYGPGFKHADLDGDGKITKEEYLKVEGRDWFATADKDKSGGITKEEWLGFAKVNHIKDTNDDTYNPEVYDKLYKWGGAEGGELMPEQYHKGMQKMAEDIMANGYGGGGKDEM